jgi:hypothetical protein
MKPLIFAYEHNNKTYYAEGFNEESIRKAVEVKLNLPSNTLQKGRKPDYNRELKEIWNRNNKNMTLLLNKDQTTPKEEVDLNKKKQHCMYELDLLLREDKDFLSGVNDNVVMDSTLEVKLYPNTGYIMAYWTKAGDNDKIYRFYNGITDAYWYVRNNIINLGISDWQYKKTNCTVLEMCDSMITGFNNPLKIDFKNSSYKINDLKRSLPLSLLYKNEDK